MQASVVMTWYELGHYSSLQSTKELKQCGAFILRVPNNPHVVHGHTPWRNGYL